MARLKNTRALSPNAQRFVEFVKNTCKRAGVRVTLVNNSFLSSGTEKCTGYFDGDSKVLRVATKMNPALWLTALAHEFIHFTQWDDCRKKRSTQGGRLWRADLKNDFSSWLAGEIELTPKQAKRSGLNRLKLEWHAERGALELLSAFNLGSAFDHKVLGQIAVLYVLLHHAMIEKRRWIRGPVRMNKAAYNPKLFRLLPRTLSADLTRKPSLALMTEMGRLL